MMPKSMLVWGVAAFAASTSALNVMPSAIQRSQVVARGSVFMADKEEEEKPQEVILGAGTPDKPYPSKTPDVSKMADSWSKRVVAPTHDNSR